MLKEDFDLAGPQKSAIGCGVIKWFYAYPISGAEKLLFLLIPNSDGKHAKELFEAGLSPFLVCIKYCFGIAMRTIPVTFGLELASDKAVIVDLSVKNQCISAIRSGHRLVARRR